MLLVKSSQPHADVHEYFVSAEYAGADPHFHLRHADCFYVLEGELDVFADGEAIRAGAGTSVVVPPGVVHGFTSVTRARFLNVHAASCGFTDYLRRVGAGEKIDPSAYDTYDT